MGSLSVSTAASQRDSLDCLWSLHALLVCISTRDSGGALSSSPTNVSMNVQSDQNWQGGGLVFVEMRMELEIPQTGLLAR